MVRGGRHKVGGRRPMFGRSVAPVSSSLSNTLRSCCTVAVGKWSVGGRHMVGGGRSMFGRSVAPVSSLYSPLWIHPSATRSDRVVLLRRLFPEVWRPEENVDPRHCRHSFARRVTNRRQESVIGIGSIRDRATDTWSGCDRQLARWEIRSRTTVGK